jgi:hypothetical protein
MVFGEAFVVAYGSSVAADRLYSPVAGAPPGQAAAKVV